MAEIPGVLDRSAKLAEVLASTCEAFETALRDEPGCVGDAHRRAVCRRLLWHGREAVELLSGRGNPVDKALVEFAEYQGKRVVNYCGGNEIHAASFMIASALFVMRLELTLVDLALEETGQNLV